MAFVKTVWYNFEGLTKKEITVDKLAYEYQGMIGRPSERYFKSMVSKNIIQNYPTTSSAVTNAYTTFFPNLAGIRGKTVQQKPYWVVMEYSAVPKDFPKVQEFLTVMEDVMFMNGALFIITMSHGIKFVKVEHTPTRTDKKLSKYLKQVMNISIRSGIIVQTVFMDMEVYNTIDKLTENVVMNTSTAK